MGCTEKYTPFGIVDEDTAQLWLWFGHSAKTSDFLVDGLEHWWTRLPDQERDAITQLQIKLDNGPQSHGHRTQFLARLVAFADTIGCSQFSASTPHLTTANTPPLNAAGGFSNSIGTAHSSSMLAWAKSATWKGIHPIVELTHTLYAKGVTLSKAAMKPIEARLERNPSLPKWDILIRPVCG